MKKSAVFHFSMLLVALLFTAGCLPSAAAGQSRPTPIPVYGGAFPVSVLTQSPAETATDLQIICLFRSVDTNTLQGALAEINQRLNGLLDQIRKPALFRGELGETILIVSPGTSLGAKKLLIIGLGESQTFTPQRMEFVGAIAYREATRLGVAHPDFAPTVLDGGVTKFTTGDIAERVVAGFLRAQRTEAILKDANASAGQVLDLTFLAGPSHAADTQQGIQRALAGQPGKQAPANTNAPPPSPGSGAQSDPGPGA